VESFCLTLIKADNRFFKFSAYTLWGFAGVVLVVMVVVFCFALLSNQFWLRTKLWSGFWGVAGSVHTKKVSTFFV